MGLNLPSFAQTMRAVGNHTRSDQFRAVQNGSEQFGLALSMLCLGRFVCAVVKFESLKFMMVENVFPSVMPC